MIKLSGILIHFVILMVLSTNAFSDMYCGNEFINIKDQYTKDKIKLLCGMPSKTKNWKEEILTKVHDQPSEEFQKTIIYYSKWTYNRGSNTFIEYLLFQDGILKEVVDGDYGTD